MNKIFWFCVQRTWDKIEESGWGNGYVAVPKTHPLFGKDYFADNLTDAERVVIDFPHGGCTWSSDITELQLLVLDLEDYWLFGFDTGHWSDTKTNWPKNRVIEETKAWAEEIKNFGEQI